METIDQVVLHFDENGLRILNMVLIVVMFSIALDLNFERFRALIQAPKALVTGIVSQLIALPLITFLLILIMKPQGSIALGMILVAACPGGNISNFLTHRALGNTALSVTMTGISTMACVLTTPLNVAIWGGLYAPSRQLLETISLDPVQIAQQVCILLLVPLVAGIVFAQRLPALTNRIKGAMKAISMLIFFAFIAIALLVNWELFLTYAPMIFGYVLAHNGAALALGFLLATIAGLSIADRRSITIETGIQNSGLGLILIFGFFEGLGGMAVIAGLWGIWHAISGFAVASAMRRMPLASSQGSQTA